MNSPKINPAIVCSTCPRRRFGVCKVMVNFVSQYCNTHSPKQFSLLAKQILFHQGEKIQDAYVLREGWIQLSRISENGDRQVFRPVLPGELLGIQPDTKGPAIYTAVAALDSVICDIPNLDTMCLSEPKLAMRVAWVAACDMVLTEMYLTNIAHRNARERIAFMALELYRRLKVRGLNDDYTIQFPLKQQDIADTLGLTAIHVNRALHALREESILKIHRHQLTILNYHKLCNLVGSDLEPMSSCDIMVDA